MSRTFQPFRLASLAQTAPEFRDELLPMLRGLADTYRGEPPGKQQQATGALIAVEQIILLLEGTEFPEVKQ